MRTLVACIAFLLAAAVCGLFVAWMINLARQGGVAQLPQMLSALGWQAAGYGLTLLALGILFLTAGIFLIAGRK